MNVDLKEKLVKSIVDWCIESKAAVQIGAVYTHPDFKCVPDMREILGDDYVNRAQASPIILIAGWDTPEEFFRVDHDGVHITVSISNNVFNVLMPYSCISSVHSVNIENGGGINFEITGLESRKSADIIPFRRDGERLH